MSETPTTIMTQRQFLASVADAVGSVIDAAFDGPLLVASACALEALVVNEVLKRSGIGARLCVGSAVWGVSRHPHGYMMHLTDQGRRISGFTTTFEFSPASDDLHSAMLHCWNSIGEMIFVTTTRTLPIKFAALEAVDGQHIDCHWHPPYLFAHRSRCLPMNRLPKPKPATFSYLRENIPYPQPMTDDVADIVGTVEMVLQMKARGVQVTVETLQS